MLGERRTTVAGVIAALAALGTVVVRAQQPQQPTFRGGVNLVQISVVATGSDGKPVHGLTKDDFTVVDRGAAQPIQGFVEIATPRPPASPFPATLVKDVSDNVSAKSDRVVILVLDDLHLKKQDEEVKSLARRVVNGLGDGTSIGLITTSGAFGMEPTNDRARVLQVIDDFIDKYQQVDPRMGIVVHGTNQPPDLSHAPGNMPGFFADMTMFKASQDVAHMLIAENSPKKAFIWLSKGIPKKCPLTEEEDKWDFRADPYDHACKEMMYAMQQANVSTYAVDPGGGSDTFLSRVSDSTGGFAIRADDLDAGLDRLIDDLNNYYVIGFVPPDPKDTKYRSIEIRVNRPGVTLRYRTGYTAAAPAANATRKVDPAVALVMGVMPKSDLRLRLSATPLAPAVADGPSPVAITIEAHGDAGRLVSQDGWLRDVMTFEIVAVDLAQKKAVVTHAEKRDVFWKPSIPVAGDVAYQVTTEIPLPAGRYQLRVSGTSTSFGTSGSVYLIADVPDSRGARLALGGLLLGYATTPPIAVSVTEEAAALPFPPTADRRFLPSDVLHVLCAFSRGAGVADTDFLIEAIDETGRVVRSATKAVGAGQAPALDVKVSLDGLALGAYVLRVTATAGANRATREVGITVR